MSDEPTKKSETRAPANGTIRLVEAPTKPATDHPSRSCASCDNSFFPEADIDQGFCRLDPPKITVFLIPGSLAGQPPRDANVSNWPIVTKRQCCKTGYERKPDLTQ